MGLLDLLFPKSCLECHLPAQAGKPGKYICDACLSYVEVLNRFNPFTKTFSIFRYEGVIRKAIIKIKYNFAYDIAEELADVCIKNYKLKIENCVLIPIPLHHQRERWRGFNQSEILGRLIAEKLNLGFENSLLIRPKASVPQVGLVRSERVQNIRGKFAVNSKAKLDQNISYIIFDDVATTGTTIQEAIKVLKKSGAQKVFGLTIAR